MQETEEQNLELLVNNNFELITTKKRSEFRSVFILYNNFLLDIFQYVFQKTIMVTSISH